MKKVGYIFLAFLLLLQAGGLLLCYEAEQMSAHWQMKRSLSKNQRPTEKLKISLTDYCKSRVGKDELRLEGRMYDIRSAKICGNEIELVVVRDRKEERAICKISGLLGAHVSDNTIGPQSLIDFMSFVYLVPEVYAVPGNATFVVPRKFASCDVSLPSSYFAIVVPPPKAVSCFI